MKKLGLVLLLPACLQQGLVADPNAVINATTTTTTGGPDPDPEPTISLTKKSAQYLKTDFGDRGFTSSRPIEGFGGGALGETFCFNNENSGGDPYDSQVTCRKPLSSSSDLPEDEDELLDVLSTSTGRENAQGLGLIIHGLQFFFSNTTTTPTDNHYSRISSLQVSLKTAPIVFDSSTGEFRWDSTNVITFNYIGSGCNPADDNAVGFDIGSDSNLGTASDRAKYFLTGLWVFERAKTKPYEASTVSPIGPYEGLSDGPSQLFSTRTNIFASLLIPSYDENAEEYGYQYFPGDNSTPTGAPSADPAPHKYSIGYYARNTVNSSTGPAISTSGEAGLTTLQSIDGAIITPAMGKYNSNAELVTATNSTVPWEKRVVTGLCISGTRTLHNGSTTAAGTYPVIHALKYQLRKIKVTLQ